MELMKAALVKKGHSLYGEIWSDQPPLLTWVNACILGATNCPWAPRLVSLVCCGVVLWTWSAMLCVEYGVMAGLSFIGLYCSIVPTLMLGVSAMQEMPMLALASLGVFLVRSNVAVSRRRIALGTLVFSLAMLCKLTAIFFLVPALWELRPAANRDRPVAGRSYGYVALGGGVLVIVLGTLVLAAKSKVVEQLFFPHLAGSVVSVSGSIHAGSPWNADLRRYSLHFLLAIVGVVFRVGRSRRMDGYLWLFLVQIGTMFWLRPWWAYYWADVAVPLCYFASVGLVAVTSLLRLGAAKWATTVWLLSLLGAAYFAGKVSYGVWTNIEMLVKAKSDNTWALVRALKQHKSESAYAYTDDNPIILLWAGKLTLPSRAVMSAKRIWSGSDDLQVLEQEWKQYRPDLALLRHPEAVRKRTFLRELLKSFVVQGEVGSGWQLLAQRGEACKEDAQVNGGNVTSPSK